MATDGLQNMRLQATALRDQLVEVQITPESVDMHLDMLRQWLMDMRKCLVSLLVIHDMSHTIPLMTCSNH